MKTLKGFVIVTVRNLAIFTVAFAFGAAFFKGVQYCIGLTIPDITKMTPGEICRNTISSYTIGGVFLGLIGSGYVYNSFKEHVVRVRIMSAAILTFLFAATGAYVGHQTGVLSPSCRHVQSLSSIYGN